jgi:hypothetical protein
VRRIIIRAPAPSPTRFSREIVLTIAAVLAAVPAFAAGLDVRVELADGAVETGRLTGISAASVDLIGEGAATRALPLDRVRTLALSDTGGGAAGDAGSGPVRLALTDGTVLGGDEFSWQGTKATLATSAGNIELPLGRVKSVEWRADGRAEWMGSVPEGTASDLVVVGKPGGFEFVECAISAIGPDTVTVVLDEETIPVKRSKVIGLRWMRADAGAALGRTVVDVVGGSLRADSVAWTDAGLVLDAADAERKTILPATALVGIDFAAGRTTRLVALAPDTLEVEPFFGALGSIEGLSRYFAPRPVPVVDRAKPALVIRPRTVAVWRIPSGGRRFRARLASTAGAGPATVTVSVDDRKVFEQVVSGEEATPVDLDLTGGRRLGVTVDFGPAGALAGAVRLEEPVIEQ